MARTAITVTAASRYLAGDDPTATAGDASNDHSLTMSVQPICLICVNSNAATVDFTIELPAAPQTWNATKSISHTIPAAAAGVDGVRVVWIDVPATVFQTGNVLHIDSADGNFGDVRFYAVTGVRTPR